MGFLDTLRRLSFAGIEIPYQSLSVHGGLRDHVHEYPHQAGGANEKLGRKLYEIRITADFEARLSNPAYADLHARLGRLRSIFEAQTTSDLVLPTIGSIKAYAIDWSQVSEAKNRSGERGEIVFREDLAAAFLTASILQEDTTRLADATSDWTVQSAIPNKPSIFDAITAAANSVLAVKDQIDLFGELVEAKILGLVALLSEADKDVRELNDPQNYRITEAMLALWQSATQLNQDLSERGVQLQQFVVPVTMDVSRISAAVFGGDSSRGADLMGLNPFPDPFAVIAGTIVRFYANV